MKILITVLLVAASLFAQSGRTIPKDTEIKVRTDVPIPAQPAAGASYAASVSDDVKDNSGAVLASTASRWSSSMFRWSTISSERRCVVISAGPAQLPSRR